MSALTTTFKELHEWDACRPGYRKLAKGLGGIRSYGRTTPIQVSKVLDICGIDDCFWVIERAALNEDYERELRLLACDYAERVLSIFESEYPGGHRPRRAIETARRYATGDASKEELADASASAIAAAEAAAKAAKAATWAAWAAASAATWTATSAATWAAIWAARDAGSADERTAQTQMLRDVLVKLEAEEPKA